MRNLPLPSRDNARADLEKALVTRQYRGKTCGYMATALEIDSILELYDNYDANLAVPSDPLKGLELTPELAQAVQNAYDLTQKNRKLENIRTLVFSDVILCPICGIDPVVELDHYLPQSLFKPLSVYTRNLVPMCHACNHTKLAGFGDCEDEDTRFLHAYFDTFPDVRFIQANIDIQNQGLVVYFGVDRYTRLPANLSGRLSNQITELQLNDRYKSEVNTYISGHAIALHMNFEAKGKEGVEAFLNLQARFEIEKFYRNHWRPVLLGALADHDAFCDGGFSDLLPLPGDILADMMGNAP